MYTSKSGFPTLLLLWFLGCGSPSPSDMNGTLLEPPMDVPDFTLESADGALSLSNFEGSYVVLAFGYTYCPDACPTTLARLAKAVDLIGEDAREVQVMLVSVDSGRDTPALLKTYTENFNPRFVGTIPADGDNMFQTFGIYAEHAGEESNEDYLIDHTTSTVVLDRQGKWRLVWNFEVSPEEMATDLKKLLSAS